MPGFFIHYIPRKQQVFCRQSVLSVGCFEFAGALSPSSREPILLQGLAQAAKCSAVSLLSLNHLEISDSGCRFQCRHINLHLWIISVFLFYWFSMPVWTCVCTSGTVSLGCPWTTKSKTFPAQMWPTCCWRTSSFGLTMRLKWLPTMGQAWAFSAIKSQSGLCREVSTVTDQISGFFPVVSFWPCP